MTNNFSSYIKTNINHKNDKNENLEQVKEMANNENVKNVEETINKYSQLSNQELFSEFLKLSEDKKKKGDGYTNSDVENMRSVLFPYLNNDQKNMFETLMNKVK